MHHDAWQYRRARERARNARYEELSAWHAATERRLLRAAVYVMLLLRTCPTRQCALRPLPFLHPVAHPGKSLCLPLSPSGCLAVVCFAGYLNLTFGVRFDGSKSDAWVVGVVVGLLAGSLPARTAALSRELSNPASNPNEGPGGIDLEN